MRKGNHKHGFATGKQAPEYTSWMHMKGRCLNPANKSFADYGGRGVCVCDRWQLFENFLADMGRKPSTSHSLDRINNDGHYEPGNCRWATRSVQNSNKRNVVLSETDVRFIRHWLAVGLYTQQRIADAFGIRQGDVANIKSGRSWGWVQ